MNEQREKLRLEEIATVMAEGNPGALKVIYELLKQDPVKGLLTILHLDDMNIRGSGIWIAYKDVCGEDLETLMRYAKDRHPQILSAVPGAVTGGASSR